MFAMIDRVAEMSTGNDWDKAVNKNVFEFLSIYSYSIAKQKHQENIMKMENEKMRAKIRSKG